MRHYEPVTAEQLAAPDLAHWQAADGVLAASFRCASFAAAGALAAEVARLADEQDHHPDLSIAWPGVVEVRTSTHVTGGITDADLRLARAIDVLVSA